MLVLTRKLGEKIVIGGRKRVVLKVLKVLPGGVVSLGFEADDSVPILRQELLEEIERENAGGAIEKDSVDVKGLAKRLKLETMQ